MRLWSLLVVLSGCATTPAPDVQREVPSSIPTCGAGELRLHTFSMAGEGYRCFPIPAACEQAPHCECLKVQLSAQDCTEEPHELVRHEPLLQ